MTTFQKLNQKLRSVKKVHSELSETIINNGGGATGLTAIMFVNASKDLTRINAKIRNTYNNGLITIEEYRSFNL